MIWNELLTIGFLCALWLGMISYRICRIYTSIQMHCQFFTKCINQYCRNWMVSLQLKTTISLYCFIIFRLWIRLGYLNESGKLNLRRFEVFMGAMSEIDRDLFREKYEDLKYMETKYVSWIFLQP